MRHRGTSLFLQRPEEFADRILHAGEVIGERNGVFTVELEEPIALQLGQDVNIYREVERQFMQQPARIVAAPAARSAGEAGDAGDTGDTDDEATAQEQDGPDRDRRFSLQTNGNLISAECRECYRVSTVMANLTATIGDEDHCLLTDISATGFSVIASARHEIETIVPATLRYEDKQFAGDARIKSIKDLVSGQTRYGLRSLEERRRRQKLAQGQQQIAAGVQRQQLRRQSCRG